MYLGIDLGTSGVKAVLVDEDERILAQHTAPLEILRPHPLWSEQEPESWWRATALAVAELRRERPRECGAVRGIGLSGQMHGATLLDRAGRVLRPAILWNDGRSAAECEELVRREPALHRISGNLAMPGFTAPKLVWVERHEPALFSRIATVCLPKDYLRLRLSGELATDASDASGTLWLDVGRREWSEALLDATHLALSAMPRLAEGSEAAGALRAEVADAWGLAPGIPIAAGAGDQAAGAVGAGVVQPGQALVSLGTSGVVFAAGDRFAPAPERGVHAFCHALPGRWHQMSVILSAASCLAWVARLTGHAGPGELLAELEREDRDPGDLLFLPYLSGERTPHNDPNAMGVFFGLSHDTDRAALGRAVLEGVAFALADGLASLEDAGTRIESAGVIGGAARSPLWRRILASALEVPLELATAAELGPAFGAARLARLAVTGEPADVLCRRPTPEEVVPPDPLLAARYRERIPRFRRLYAALRGLFAEPRS